MAITQINITQDNIIGSSNLLPAHNPLVFIAQVTYSGATPSVLYARIYDVDDNLLFEGKAIPYKDPTATTRTFLFDSDKFIRSQMNGFDDVLQLDGTFLFQENPTKQLKIAFYDNDSLIESTKLEITVIHGAAQFGEYPNKESIYGNEPQTYYCKVGSFVYVYYYNTDITNVVTITDNGVNVGAFPATLIGYYRYKTSIANKVVNFTDDGSVNVDHSIIEQGCANDALIKYLDKNGQNRYFTFNEFYETRDNSQSIGSIRKLVTNIRTDQSDKTQIGKRTQRSISLISQIENEELQLAADLVQSPRVYLYIGTLPSDIISDWLQVEVLTNDSLIRRRIGTSGTFELSIQLPGINNITSL